MVFFKGIYYYIKSLLLFCRNYSILKQLLLAIRERGVIKVRPTHRKYWMDYGRGTHAFRFFYKGYVRSEAVFLKCGNDDTLENEYNFVQLTNEEANPYFLKCNFSISLRGGVIICYEFLPLAKISNNISYDAFSSMCLAINETLDYMSKKKIWHCDLSIRNVLLVKGSLKIIDYGNSYSYFFPKKIDYLGHYCTDKTISTKNNETQVIFDDAHSFVELLKTIGFPKHYYQDKNYKRIMSRIGDNILTITI